MASPQPKTRFSKVMEILLWLAGLGVLAENIFLFQQNRRLNQALALKSLRERNKVTEQGLWPVQDVLGIAHSGTHSYRLAAASEPVEGGAPLTVVQQQLRHGDAKTTLQKYGHVEWLEIRSAVQSTV